MGDPLKKVQPGQKLRIPSAAYNAFIDTTRAFQARQFEQGTPPSSTQRSSGLVRVKNASGSAMGRFGVLGIDTILFSPTDNSEEFQNRPCLSCVTPAASHAGKFVILQEPLEVGGIGLAVIAGISVVQLSVTAESDGWADVDAAAVALKTGTAGSAHVIYKESGTGAKLGLVRLGPPERFFAVTVTHDGGSAGSPTSNCTLTYTAKNLSGVTLGTGLTPEVNGRYSNCQYTVPAADSPGIGYWVGSTFHLYHVAQERPTGDVVTLATNVSWDGTNLKQTQRNVLVLEAYDEGSPTIIDTAELGCT